MRITWTTPPAATALHAAIAALDGAPLIDPRVARQAAAAADGCSREDLIRTAGGLLTGSAVPAPAESPLEAILAALPERGEELGYRVRPLREQWEARGPGLLRRLEHLTEPIGVGAATIALVLPVTGGHGVALPGFDAVMLEAVLANPNPELPEVLRLAWLLAQLAGGASPVALVPAVLAAAAEVELATTSEALLADALVAWRLAANGPEASRLAARWWRWWLGYAGQSTPWRRALASAPDRSR